MAINIADDGKWGLAFRANWILLFNIFVGPDGKTLAIGRRAGVSVEHCWVSLLSQVFCM